MLCITQRSLEPFFETLISANDKSTKPLANGSRCVIEYEWGDLFHVAGDPGPIDLGRRLELPIDALLLPILRVSFA